MRLAVFIVLLGVVGVHSASQCSANSYTYSTTGTERNPLRGFVVYNGPTVANTFPFSLEYADVGYNAMMSGPNTFTFPTSVEPILSSAASRGNQVVLRPVLDIPGDPSYVPSFLTTGPGAVTFTHYTEYGGGESPSYNNARLIGAIQNLFAALGAQYDGDPRLAFLQIGTLGYWGEWHTFPNASLFANYTTQMAVLKAFDDNFDITPGMISQDQFENWDLTTPPPTANTYNVGWLDDSFAESTYSAPNGGQAWYFYGHLKSHNSLTRYQTVPIGGEILPDLQDTIFKTSGYTGQPYMPCVANTHPTYLLMDRVSTTISGTERTNAIAGHVALGYQYHIAAVRVINPDTCSAAVGASSKCVQIYIDLMNKGVAPFYYPLALSVVVASTGQAFNSSDMHTLQPSNISTTYTIEVAFPANSAATLSASVRLYTPYTLFPIKFTTLTAGDALPINITTSCAHNGAGPGTTTSATSFTSVSSASSVTSTSASASTAGTSGAAATTTATAPSGTTTSGVTTATTVGTTAANDTAVGALSSTTQGANAGSVVAPLSVLSCVILCVLVVFNL